MSGQEHNKPSGGESIEDSNERYRTYLKKLKQGRTSGISGIFGNAMDLLGAEGIEKAPESILKSLKVGDNLWNKPLEEDFRQALESLVLQAANPAFELGAQVQTPNGLLEIVACFIENGERMYIMSDMSIMSGIELLNCMEAAKSSGDHNQGQALPTADKKESQPVPAVAIQSLEEPQSRQVVSPVMQPIRVSAPNGMWLWDVHFKDGELDMIDMADGGWIVHAENAPNYIMFVPQLNTHIPRVVILDKVSVDRETGNIYWHTLGSASTGAFLNNGWRIDQLTDESSQPPRSFITEPLSFETTERASKEVSDLVIDRQSGEVTYEEPACGAVITLRSRRI